MKKIIIAFCILFAGCSVNPEKMPTIDLMIGHKIASDDFVGRNPSGTLRANWSVGERSKIGIEHISQWRDGEPWNDRNEDTIDQVMYTIEFGNVRNSYRPRIEISTGFKLRKDGFEGDRLTKSFKFKQPIIHDRFYCEYYYIESSFWFFDTKVDDLQQISCGFSFYDK